jgi:hypothetical protein
MGGRHKTQGQEEEEDVEPRSYDTLVVDADGKPLGRSFALFKDLASACTTIRWCLLMELRAFQRPRFRLHHRSVVPPYGSFVRFIGVASACAAGAWWLPSLAGSDLPGECCEYFLDFCCGMRGFALWVPRRKTRRSD